MNIVVTGSKGTIGRHLCPYLRSKGHTVSTIDLFNDETPDHYRADVGFFFELDVIFSKIVNKHGPVDVVIHLAAEVARLSGEIYYDKLWTSNATGTKNILRLQELGYFDKLIFFSSSEVYGDAIESGELIEELTETQGCFPKNDYGISKLVNEMQIRNHVAKTNLPCIICRIFTAYGAGTDYVPVFKGIIYDICWWNLTNTPYTIYKDYTRTFMYIDDLLPTINNMIKNFTPGTFNVGTIETVTMKELNEIIVNHLGTNESLVTYKETDNPYTVFYKKPNISKAAFLFDHNPKISIRDGACLVADYMKKRYFNA